MSAASFKPYQDYREYPVEEMRRRAAVFHQDMQRRRTVRDFSDRAVPRDIIENCLGAAGSAPSGANRQPWHFVLVSDPAVKRRIREAAEAEEREFYERRATPEWLEALVPLGTDPHKPFLEIAPWLIAIFAQSDTVLPNGRRLRNYYVAESVGIATGVLIAAIHQAGLACLTHTPSPMGFLREVLGRPEHERAFVVIPVGYPADDCVVPDLKRKSLNEIAVFVE